MNLSYNLTKIAQVKGDRTSSTFLELSYIQIECEWIPFGKLLTNTLNALHAIWVRNGIRVTCPESTPYWLIAQGLLRFQYLILNFLSEVSGVHVPSFSVVVE